MNVSQFKNWLQEKIDWIQANPCEEWNESNHLEVKGFIDEAYEHAVNLHLPEAADACRRGPVTIRLLECLNAIPSTRTLLTPPEIAEQDGFDEETVRGWIRSGQLRASNLANASRPRYVVRPEDWEAFLASRQINPPPPQPARIPQPTIYQRFSED